MDFSESSDTTSTGISNFTESSHQQTESQHEVEIVHDPFLHKTNMVSYVSVDNYNKNNQNVYPMNQDMPFESKGFCFMDGVPDPLTECFNFLRTETTDSREHESMAQCLKEFLNLHERKEDIKTLRVTSDLLNGLYGELKPFEFDYSSASNDQPLIEAQIKEEPNFDLNDSKTADINTFSSFADLKHEEFQHLFYNKELPSLLNVPGELDSVMSEFDISETAKNIIKQRFDDILDLFIHEVNSREPYNHLMKFKELGIIANRIGIDDKCIRRATTKLCKDFGIETKPRLNREPGSVIKAFKHAQQRSKEKKKGDRIDVYKPKPRKGNE